jgi:hypothetical protein
MVFVGMIEICPICGEELSETQNNKHIHNEIDLEN